MSTVTITAADVNKLRQQTGAGMMDCKKALGESNGDFEAAVDYLRKKGQKVAANRSDRDAKEGLVIGATTADGKKATLISLNCETDFVAINEDFGKFAQSISAASIANNVKTVDELKALSIDGVKLSDKLMDYVAKIGEKIDVTRFEVIEAECVVAYNHPGNRVATIAGFNKKVDTVVAKDVAMQIAAMAPVALDKGDVDASMLERELEIAKEQIRAEGKPEEMVEKIAQGKIAKFYKESTLLNQEFIKDAKKTVSQYLNDAEKGLTVTAFKRISLGN
ncbi:MAG: translation elongation factor Ts [Bacteroidota bacterium]